jgi:hypothetical protein
LNAGQYGPAINAFYPLGYYIEDFEYIAGLGDLDEHNGRFCVTPEYPSGTYAYFVTVDSLLQGEYPYTLGPKYYGLVPTGNTGPGSGHNVISEVVTVYSPTNIVADENIGTRLTAFPNPATDKLAVGNGQFAMNTVEIFNADGRNVKSVKPSTQGIPVIISVHDLSPGVYFLLVKDTNLKETIQKIVVAR